MAADPALVLAEHVCQTTFTALPRSAVLATTNAVHRLAMNTQGLPLVSELPA